MVPWIFVLDFENLRVTNYHYSSFYGNHTFLIQSKIVGGYFINNCVNIGKHHQSFYNNVQLAVTFDDSRS